MFDEWVVCVSNIRMATSNIIRYISRYTSDQTNVTSSPVHCQNRCVDMLTVQTISVRCHIYIDGIANAVPTPALPGMQTGNAINSVLREKTWFRSFDDSLQMQNEHYSYVYNTFEWDSRRWDFMSHQCIKYQALQKVQVINDKCRIVWKH